MACNVLAVDVWHFLQLSALCDVCHGSAISFVAGYLIRPGPKKAPRQAFQQSLLLRAVRRQAGAACLTSIQRCRLGALPASAVLVQAQLLLARNDWGHLHPSGLRHRKRWRCSAIRRIMRNNCCPFARAKYGVTLQLVRDW